MNSQRRCVSWLPPGGSQGVLTFSVYVLVGVDTLVAPYSGEAKGEIKKVIKKMLFPYGKI